MARTSRGRHHCGCSERLALTARVPAPLRPTQRTPCGSLTGQPSWRPRCGRATVPARPSRTATQRSMWLSPLRADGGDGTRGTPDRQTSSHGAAVLSSRFREGGQGGNRAPSRRAARFAQRRASDHRCNARWDSPRPEGEVPTAREFFATWAAQLTLEPTAPGKSPDAQGTSQTRPRTHTRFTARLWTRTGAKRRVATQSQVTAYRQVIKPFRVVTGTTAKRALRLSGFGVQVPVGAPENDEGPGG